MINFYILRSGQTAVRHLCSILRGMIFVFLVIQLGYFTFSWGAQGNYHLGFMQVALTPDGLTMDELMRLGFEQRLIGIALGMPALGMLFYAIVQFNGLLTYIKEGKVFAMHTIAAMQTSVGALLLYMVLANLEKPLRAVIFNATESKPGIRIVFSVSGNEWLLLFVCALFYVLAAIMHEGRRLEEENKGFV